MPVLVKVRHPVLTGVGLDAAIKVDRAGIGLRGARVATQLHHHGGSGVGVRGGALFAPARPIEWGGTVPIFRAGKPTSTYHGYRLIIGSCALTC